MRGINEQQISGFQLLKHGFFNIFNQFAANSHSAAEELRTVELS